MAADSPHVRWLRVNRNAGALPFARQIQQVADDSFDATYTARHNVSLLLAGRISGDLQVCGGEANALSGSRMSWLTIARIRCNQRTLRCRQ
jgi:hypothetical protein